MSTASKVGHLPGYLLFPHLPAVPIDLEGMLETLARLAIRAEQANQAKLGLTETFTIGGVTDVAYAFLFGDDGGIPAADAMSELEQRLREHRDSVLELFDKLLREGTDASTPTPAVATRKPVPLEDPRQFSISWTRFPDVYQAGQSSLPAWAGSLTDADTATTQFWPMIAGNGFAYNLLVTEKVASARRDALQAELEGVWTGELDAASAAGNLYVIDMSRFEALQRQIARGACRFTPSTITFLTQDPATKALTPVAIVVSGHQGQGREHFTRTDAAWLYALQAAKASITVFGVWLGHVYHWHLVTAAMQMTMFNTFHAGHPIYKLLAPQSKYAISFDDVLIALWGEIAPPTSITTAWQFLELANDYAAGRNYFDDDPKTTLSRMGLVKEDFTVKTQWDQYPLVAFLLAVWDLVEEYVTSFVDATYPDDGAVANDHDLQAWIATSSAKHGGNIRGLPAMKSRAALASVLTSLLYRVTAHGVSRLNATANPALTFVANFPHCLQNDHIPAPADVLSTKELLAYLPNTETIGEAVNFYFTFVFSPPYEPFIPTSGIETNLFFSDDLTDPRNQALVKFRSGLVSLIKQFDPETLQRFQWPLNVET